MYIYLFLSGWECSMEGLCDFHSSMGYHCCSRYRELGLVYFANTITNIFENHLKFWLASGLLFLLFYKSFFIYDNLYLLKKKSYKIWVFCFLISQKYFLQAFKQVIILILISTYLPGWIFSCTTLPSYGDSCTMCGKICWLLT